jgi:cell division protein FtsN
MQPPQRGGFVVGLVIGLLIGLAVALAVALYVTKAPIPFINKVPLRSAEQDAAEAERNKNWDPNAPLAGKTPARPSPTASGAVAGAPASGGMTTVIEPPVPAVPASRPLAAASAPVSRDTAARPAALPPAPGTVPARAAAPAGSAPVTAFYVQAGAYARPDDADAQRAKLALLGLSARITEREQAGRTVYRVRVGPFDTREQAEDAQLKLAAGGVEANLVRVER